MKRYNLKLELQEDVIISERSATVGGHRSLDYISGATIYGASAANLYGRLNKEDSFIVYHSGKIRFGNGYPLAPDGEVANPVPFTWYTAKGVSCKKENCTEDYQGMRLELLDGSKVFSFDEVPSGKQPKQLRKGFVTSTSGILLQPNKSFRMKTAINLDSGTAAQSQLFGYEALLAGQIFQATLDFDDDVEQCLLEKVIQSLNGDIRLGRSRSAQYSTVYCELKEGVPPVSNDIDLTKEITFYLLSDLALYNEKTGAPALWPEPKFFDLEGGTINEEKTALRFRHYSPFNGFRKCHDQERHVIEQGSVITIKLDYMPNKQSLAKLANGIGLYRYNGLGQLLVNPSWITCPVSGELSELVQEKLKKQDTLNEPEDELVLWLKSRVDSGKSKRQDRKIAQDLSADFQNLYRSACRYNGETIGADIGPGKTQWGLIYETGKKYSCNNDEFHKEIALICSDDDDKWGLATGDPVYPTFASWIKNQLNRSGEIKNAGLLAANLARLAMNTISSQSRKTKENEAAHD